MQIRVFHLLTLRQSFTHLETKIQGWLTTVLPTNTIAARLNNSDKQNKTKIMEGTIGRHQPKRIIQTKVGPNMLQNLLEITKMGKILNWGGAWTGIKILRQIHIRIKEAAKALVNLKY